jgi:hypothetical protein
VEVRDQLPDLLHERLSGGERAAVLAHVESCAECREELALVRVAHRAMVMATPRIDIGRIVSALPAPPSANVVPIRAARSRWSDWRIAAAITVLAVGGTSVALLNRGTEHRQAPTIPPPVVAITNTPSVAPTPVPESSEQKSTIAPKVRVAETEPAIAAAVDTPADDEISADVAVQGRLTGLSERQLRTLLNDIGQLKATPVTEPEPVTIKVDPRSSGTDELEIM